MKLCRYSGPRHSSAPCIFCWPLLRYPQPLSPIDAVRVCGDLLFERRWFGFAFALAEQMEEHYKRQRYAPDGPDGWDREELIRRLAYWRGVGAALFALKSGARDKSPRKAAA